MVDLDPIDENIVQEFEAERRKLEALADRLSPPEAAANWADSDEGKNAGAILAQMIGEGLRGLILADRPPRIPSARRPWRFTSPAQAAAAAPPLRPVATAPPAEMMPGVQSEPPKASGTPNTEMSFVGFLPIIEKAADSPRFPREYLEGHSRRLDIDDRTPLPRSKELKGPIVGGIIPSE